MKKNVHFEIPDIYGESLSFYEILNKLCKLLNKETQDRKQSDDKLKHDIGTEASAREQADTTLQQNINTEKTELSELKGELANSKKAIAELNDKKITKFYANSLGKTTLNDSDNGKIQDILIFGKSVQDGTPTPENPIEIQSVVNPVVTLSDGENSKTATLPYTLNAIPVSGGGNVTIDGQQYISDYVDIEQKKLVRNVEKVKLSSDFNWVRAATGLHGFPYFYVNNVTKKSLYGTDIKGSLFTHMQLGNPYSADGTTDLGWILSTAAENTIRVFTINYHTLDDFKTFLNNNDVYGYYCLLTPETIDLTDEEVQAFKELATYYPTTNVLVTSDQIEGCTTFNYRISIANGWNYVKGQLGDTRDYIYDMDLQSAEAYVNSEYAVALAELEV